MSFVPVNREEKNKNKNKNKKKRKQSQQRNHFVDVTWFFDENLQNLCVYSLIHSHCWPLIAWPFSDCATFAVTMHTTMSDGIRMQHTLILTSEDTVTYRSTISLCLHFLRQKTSIHNILRMLWNVSIHRPPLTDQMVVINVIIRYNRQT